MRSRHYAKDIGTPGGDPTSEVASAPNGGGTQAERHSSQSRGIHVFLSYTVRMRVFGRPYSPTQSPQRIVSMKQYPELLVGLRVTIYRRYMYFSNHQCLQNFTR